MLCHGEFDINTAKPLEEATMSSYGDTNCGKWLDTRKSNSANDFEQRAVGYFDALARAKWIDVWTKPTKITPSQLFYMIDNECQKNPALSLQDSLWLIYFERAK